MKMIMVMTIYMYIFVYRWMYIAVDTQGIAHHHPTNIQLAAQLAAHAVEDEFPPIWYGVSLWPILVRCHNSVLSQLVGPFAVDGLSSVQLCLAAAINIGTLSTLFLSWNQKHHSRHSEEKKFYPRRNQDMSSTEILVNKFFGQLHAHEHSMCVTLFTLTVWAPKPTSSAICLQWWKTNLAVRYQQVSCHNRAKI